MLSTVNLLTYRYRLDVSLHTYTVKFVSESEVKVWIVLLFISSDIISHARYKAIVLLFISSDTISHARHKASTFAININNTTCRGYNYCLFLTINCLYIYMYTARRMTNDKATRSLRLVSTHMHTHTHTYTHIQACAQSPSPVAGGPEKKKSISQ